MPLDVGQTFAGYTIMRRLGAGGMGEVYLAQHPRLPRRDALKLLARDVSADPNFRERFLREADLASTLWHPHIVGVHDRGEHDGQLWIAMDFVDGQDAAHLLAQRYPAGMPQELAIAIVTDVAAALDYAHKQGLLHRDVKPANIMLTHVDDEDDRRILLTDFGIARPVDDVSGLTTTNMTVGTVAYCAPEQLMGEAIDGRADQYSLAATYHLLTGSAPFPHSNPAVVISRHLNTPPPTLADTRPELATLDPVLAAALAKNPDDRFARCIDFARALAEQTATADAASPVAPTTPAPIRRKAASTSAPPVAHQPKPAQKQGLERRLLALAAAGSVIVVAAVAVTIWRPWEPRDNESAAPASPPPPTSSSPTPELSAPPMSAPTVTSPPAGPPPQGQPRRSSQHRPRGRFVVHPRPAQQHHHRQQRRDRAMRLRAQRILVATRYR